VYVLQGLQKSLYTGKEKVNCSIRKVGWRKPRKPFPAQKTVQ